jgi:hypothetical protein
MIKDCIIEAIKLSSLKLRDFRATSKPADSDFDTSVFVTPALQTLRIVLTKGDILRLYLSDLFETATGLRVLSLSLKDTGNNQESGRSMVDSVMTGHLLRRLEQQPHFQRLELSGNWVIQGKHQVGLVTSQVEFLRCLILNETKILAIGIPL